MINNPIGVFDSGVGGLSVVKSIIDILPNENLFYFGDTKRAPYGIRTEEELLRFSDEIANFLIKNNCKVIVVACNTSCVTSLNYLKENFNLPIIEVIMPAVSETLKFAKSDVGLFATKSTVNSGAHKKLLTDEIDGNKNLNVYGVSCSKLVEVIEQNFFDEEKIFKVVSDYYEEIRDKNIDTLILGCTHFPLVKNIIGKVVGDDVYMVDPSLKIAEELKRVLEEKNLMGDSENPKHLFCYSGDKTVFEKSLFNILNKEYETKQVILGN